MRAPTKTSSGAMPRSPMKNPSRERRKAERIALRAELERLERTLATRLAARDELRKRRLAECTNHELQEALGRQEKLLARLTQELTTKGSTAWTVPSFRLHDPHGRRFAMLLDDVEQAFHEDLGTILTTTDRSEEFTTRLVRHRDDLVLSTQRSTLAVCSLRRCGEALWAASEEIARATHANAWCNRPSRDVVLLRLHARDMHPDTKQTWEATSSMVQKRFWTGDRMALVWRAVTSIDNREDLADVYVDETGWTIVTEDDDGVRVIECVHTVPRSTRQDDGEDHDPDTVGTAVKQFTRHVMNATMAHLDTIRDRMENLLIEDCMRDVEPSSSEEE